MKGVLLNLFLFLLITQVCSCPQISAQTVQPTRKLPLIESKTLENNGYYVILLTGNGGWRKLVQSLTRYLNSKNVSVLALNTKQYLLSEKKPVQIACDLENLINRYDSKWGQDKVVFLGYSMGAEVLPFAVNFMNDKYREKIQDLILIGPWQKATFKIKLADYFYEVNKGADIYTELMKMNNINAYIICDDKDCSICHKNLDGVVDHDMLAGGHHFGGDYISLSKLVGNRLHLE
jgi:type IV secretory pathway VirJ component